MKQKNKLYKTPNFTKKRFVKEVWWANEKVLIALIISFTLLDACTLYEIFQEICTQSPMTSLILTFGAALALNFIPLLLVRLYTEHAPKWMLMVALAVFLLLFAALFYLRWETSAKVFAAGAGGMSTLNVQDRSTEEEGQVAVTFLLGILPLVTSAINAGLAYFQNAAKNKIKQLEVRKAEVKQHISVVQAAICELESTDWSQWLRRYDEQQYNEAVSNIQATTAMIKSFARMELVKKLKDAETISYVLENEAGGE